MNKNKKIGRNELCLCGSGKKYKNCCMQKETKINNSNQTNISTKELLGLIRFGLENLNALENNSKKINTKGIGILNNSTIECKFYPYSQFSIDIKSEIARIMEFIYSFLNDNVFWNKKTNYIAIRAYDKNENEIIYAISSFQNAKFIANGKTIEWLNGTIFQDNTKEYRLSIAKKQISEIENSLRHVINNVLSTKYGEKWWDISCGKKLSNKVKNLYENQFDEIIANGNILIKYTHILQLKKIICTNWKDFKHLFPNKIEFENSIDELNVIRREEAHNRAITGKHLKDLQII